jgi:hypothetical protein
MGDCIGDYEIIKGGEYPHDEALLRRDDGKMTVVTVDWNRGQVYSYMPGDLPADGGRWVARICGAGVDYVASWYSASYARRVWRQRQQA